MKISKFTVVVLIATVAIDVSLLIASELTTKASSVVTGMDVPAYFPAAQSPASFQGTLTINDPYLAEQWALTQLKAQNLWRIAKGKPEIIVAVLDTGIDKNHKDLNGKVVAEVNFADSVTLDDTYGHGTHVAGIIAANANSDIGIGGLAPASRLMNIKVGDDAGRSQASAVTQGILWAVDNGASIINISVELRKPSAKLEQAVNYAWSRGALIVAAAGNDGSDSPMYPGFYENCIAVAAIKPDHTLAPLSNYGDWVDVVAPGFNIYSTLPNDTYGYKTGTSFSAAYISGLAALLFGVTNDSNGDGRINDEVRAAIEAYRLKLR